MGTSTLPFLSDHGVYLSQERYVSTVVLDTLDLVKFFIEIDMPGYRRAAVTKFMGVESVTALIKYNDSPSYPITIGRFPVCSLAATFAIETANVPGWNPDALIEKITEGPPELQGKWIVSKAVAGFGPERYTGDDVAVRDIKNTTTAKYPSRTEFEMQNHQVVLVNFCTRKVID